MNIIFHTQHTVNKILNTILYETLPQLVLRGEFEFSGAGNPPHHNTNEVICNTK